MCQSANLVCHHRASHHWLANAVLLRLALLITGRRISLDVESDARRAEVSAN